MDKSFSYQKHIIAYLDILNFKKIVQDDAYNDLFATLFALINSFAGRDMASMRLKGIKTAVLSDSLIFSIRYSEKAAFHKILNLAEVVQTFLLEKEIITRGAISIGALYHKDNVVFGPALVDAYLLQEHVAVYPRCIIEPETLQAGLKTCASDVSRVTEMQDMYQDTDGFWVLDLFRRIFDVTIYSDAKHGTSFLEDKLSQTRNFILKNLNETQTPRVRAKYEWLKNSYNHAIRSVSETHHCEEALMQYLIDTPPIVDRDGGLV